MLFDPEKKETLEGPAHQSFRSCVGEAYSRLFGEEAVFCFFEDEENNRFFDAVSVKIDEPESLLRFPEGYGGVSMEERLWALAQIKAILPDNNLVAQRDTHNKSLENYMKLALLTAQDLTTLSVHFSVLLAKIESEPDNKMLASQLIYIWAPLAGVVGLYDLKSYLQDSAFTIIHPNEAADIKRELELLLAPNTDTSLDLGLEARELEGALRNELAPDDVGVRVDSREKSVFSIWQKKQAGSSDISDYYGLRVIVWSDRDDEAAAKEACYKVKELLLGYYGRDGVNFERTKDHIAFPKPNGYESLHITCDVLGRGTAQASSVEVQIRTLAMHERTETRSSLYQQYSARKPSIGRRDSSHVLKKEHSIYKWRSMVAEALAEHGEYSASDVVAAGDLLIFNRDANLFTLGEGSTALDCAFRIHSDHASRTTATYLLRDGARVLVPYDRALRNGDCIELTYADKDHPTWTEDWKRLVNSKLALEWLKKAAKERDADLFVLKAYQMIAEIMVMNKWRVRSPDALSDEQKQALAEGYGYKQFELLLRDIGAGCTKGAGRIAKVLSDTPIPKREAVADEGEVIFPGLPSDLGLSYHIAECCQPRNAKLICATWSARLSGLNVHASDCLGVVSYRGKKPGLVFSAAWK